jgi:hypothetical protein
MSIAVSVNTVSDISYFTAISGGEVTDGNGATSRGVCWRKLPGVTLDNCEGYTTNGTGSGAFTSALSPLRIGSLYFVKAYATVAGVTTYSPEIYFVTHTFALPSWITDYTAVSPPIDYGDYSADNGNSANLTTLPWAGSAYDAENMIWQGGANQEASDITWHPRLQKWVWIDDGEYTSNTPARMYMCDVDGANLKKVKLQSSWADTEAICIADPESDFIYVGREQIRMIDEYSIADFLATSDDAVITYKRRFNVSAIVPLSGTDGLEGMTFIPHSASPEGGYFALVCQWNHQIYIAQLSIATGGTTVTHMTDAPWNSPWANVIDGVSYDMSTIRYDHRYGILWVIYDWHIERLVALDPDGATVRLDMNLPQAPWWTSNWNYEGFAVTEPSRFEMRWSSLTINVTYQSQVALPIQAIPKPDMPVPNRQVWSAPAIIPKTNWQSIECSPGTMVQSTDAEKADWVNMPHAVINDATETVVTLSDGQSSEDLRALNFGFDDLPDGATVVGILVGYKGRYTGDMQIKMLSAMVGGVLAGSNRNTELILPQSETTSGIAVVGEEAGLGVMGAWGFVAPSYEDVKAADFGVVISVESVSGEGTFAIDHIWMEIFWTL